EFAFDILRAMASILAEGKLATLSNLKINDSRKVRRYLEAFEMVFLVTRNRIHNMGVGTDSWFLADSGLAYHLMKKVDSDSTLVSIVRHLLWNEPRTYLALRGIRDERTYFKSAKGSPVDWMWDGIPFKIITSMKSLGWEEKALLGAMKKLKSKTGYLIAPIDESIPPENGRGIGILPWGIWS
ncbi:MAG: hypothetical protein NTV34_02580, partial [Proteobacteria bacterium]|nr:hypothetical protein [Pseudomonadota bacterium]